MVEVTVSGAVYDDGLDPLATDFPKEAGLPVPAYRKVGRGARYTYNVDAETAKRMAWHLESVGISWTHSDDAWTRTRGKGMIAAAEKIRSLIS